jgi:hypothetical protein
MPVFTGLPVRNDPNIQNAPIPAIGKISLFFFGNIWQTYGH